LCSIGGMVPSAPSSMQMEFWVPYLASTLLFAAVFFVSTKIGPVAWPKLFAKYRTEQEASKNKVCAKSLLCHSTVTAAPLALVIVPLVWEPASRLLETWWAGEVNPWTIEADPAILMTTAIALGHTTVDTAFLLFYRKPLLAAQVDSTGKKVKNSAAMRETYWWQMLGHHFGCLYMWTTGIFSGRAVAYIVYCLCTEVTLPFVELRWFLAEAKNVRKFNKKPPSFLLDSVYSLNGLVLLCVWTIIRIVPIPFVLWTLLTGDFSAFSWYHYILCWLAVPIPLYLNSLWYYLLVKGALKLYLAKGTKEDAEGLQRVNSTMGTRYDDKGS